MIHLFESPFAFFLTSLFVLVFNIYYLETKIVTILKCLIYWIGFLVKHHSSKALLSPIGLVFRFPWRLTDLSLFLAFFVFLVVFFPPPADVDDDVLFMCVCVCVYRLETGLNTFQEYLFARTTAPSSSLHIPAKKRQSRQAEAIGLMKSAMNF